MKSKKWKTVEVGFDEFLEHVESRDGVCLGCGVWTVGGVEGDAEKIGCEQCGYQLVFGADMANVMGTLAIQASDGSADDDEDGDEDDDAWMAQWDRDGDYLD